jgi:16S rRNA (guanine527-N7)-methyltransferase
VLEEARRLGFLGPGPLEEQLAHASAFGPLLPPPGGRRLVDLGSGGGLPGLVLAEDRRDDNWWFVDANQRRAAFLRAAVASLGLTRVEVVTSRAEALPPDWRGSFDAVTARGFGAPPVVAECAAPLLRIGGVLVVSEPPGGAPDRWPGPGLARLGLELDQLVPGPPAFVRLRCVFPAPDLYPRRVGLPAKRPLW